MSGEIAYKYPVFIFLALGVAVGIFLLLMRLVSTPEKKASWKCLLCGAGFVGKEHDGYKYCPYCGTRRGTRIGPGKTTTTDNNNDDDDYADIDEELLT